MKEKSLSFKHRGYTTNIYELRKIIPKISRDYGPQCHPFTLESLMETHRQDEENKATKIIRLVYLFLCIFDLQF